MRVSLVSRMIDRQQPDFSARSLTGYHPVGTSQRDMTRTKKILTSAFSLLLLVGVVAPAGAKCVFKKSCTRNAFKCFQPKGTCSEDVSGDGSQTLCWSDGARISSASGVTTILGRKGKPCVTGTIQQATTGESEVAYVRHGKTWVLRNNLDGTRSFVGPKGKVDTYSQDDFRSGITCGRLPVFGAGSACTPCMCQ